MFERLPDGVRRGSPLRIVVDGTPVQAFAGESVAAALLTADRVAFRRTPRSGAPRGVFCAMGVCFECLVTIDGVSRIRACTAAVQDGMRIETGLETGIGPATTSTATATAASASVPVSAAAAASGGDSDVASPRSAAPDDEAPLS